MQGAGRQLDDCVLWVGLPVMTEDGTSLGMVGNVTFNRITGMVDTFDTDSGATANALLGKRTIPADLVKGFRRGMGAALAQVGSEGRETDEVVLGAMLVDDAAKDLVAEGGVAEKAGAVTASPSTRCTPRWTGRSRWSARPPRKPAKW